MFFDCLPAAEKEIYGTDLCFASAAEHYEQALALWPDSNIICNNFGILLSDGDRDLSLPSAHPEYLLQAIDLFKKSMRLEPEKIVAPTYLAIAYLGLAQSEPNNRDHDRLARETLALCRQILQKDDEASKKNYDDAYKENKRARFVQIEAALDALVAAPALVPAFELRRPRAPLQGQNFSHTIKP